MIAINRKVNTHMFSYLKKKQSLFLFQINISSSSEKQGLKPLNNAMFVAGGVSISFPERKYKDKLICFQPRQNNSITTCIIKLE